MNTHAEQLAAVQTILASPAACRSLNRWWIRAALRWCYFSVKMPQGDVRLGYPWNGLLLRLLKERPGGQLPEPEFLKGLAQGMDDLDAGRIVDLRSVRRRLAIYEARQALEEARTSPVPPRGGSSRRSGTKSRRRHRSRPSRGSSSR